MPKENFDHELRKKKKDEPKLLKVKSTELKQDANRKEIISHTSEHFRLIHSCS